MRHAGGKEAGLACFHLEALLADLVPLWLAGE
jgi:hypothetical protein